MKEGANRTLRTLRVVKDLISYYLLCGASGKDTAVFQGGQDQTWPLSVRGKVSP